ncbi:hypothetical protein OS242_10685 [Tumebacillus sp. DT12]|uniref:Uncharacterized protein n=1 Tax=Tumebacillus lacus TaxID=2995335 RepID=A0ABT3X0J3_9BACL|nr:hypothetical protein [Tumebacillus lacus]MCX7570429.1 hypothetical protein [Tumebacillus lacus]
MTRDNTIPIQLGQYGPDPIIQFRSRNATVPIDPAKMSIAPPLARFVPTDPSRRQEPQGPLMKIFVPTALRPIAEQLPTLPVPVALMLGSDVEPRSDIKPPDPALFAGREPQTSKAQFPPEPERASDLPPGMIDLGSGPLVQKNAPPIPYVSCDMALSTAPHAEQLPTGYEPISAQEVPPGHSQFPPQPIMSEVPVGFEPIRAEQVPAGYDLIAA